MKSASIILMRTSPLSCAHGKLLFLTTLVLLASNSMFLTDASCSSLLVGKVSHAITAISVPGVTIEIYRGRELLGTAHSGPKGRFSLAFEVKTKKNSEILTVLVTHDEFASFSDTVQFLSGKLGQSAYHFSLLPKPLAKCRVSKGHYVIIGHFKPPVSETYSELSSRIADTLYSNITKQLQQYHIPLELQPIFLACDEAKPRALIQGKIFAKALKAHAFVCGSVKRVEKGFDVRIVISEPYGIFSLPCSEKNECVDLDDSLEAQLSAKTCATILISIATGYEHNGLFAEAVYTTKAAEDILGKLTPEIKKIREKCKRNLPQRELLSGGSP